ncbi:MAG: DUF3472 domain-containing protein [Myxococcales bacterium]|nr:DUF3472 domain-containing protein [Myxococcales bacterium]
MRARTFAFSLLTLLVPAAAGAAVVQMETGGFDKAVTPGGMAYAWWSWPAPPVGGGHTGWFNRDVNLTIEADPGTAAALFWSHQFHFQGGDGGYIGLQTSGNIGGVPVGKMALVSIWQALGGLAGSPGSVCQTFGGEGTGWSCRIPYDWQEGRTYRLRLWEYCCAETPGAAEWWTGSVTDLTTGVETILGRIQVPGGWDWIDGVNSGTWVEYYGSVPTCDDIPYSVGRFDTMRANAGAVAPTGSTTTLGGAPRCPGKAAIAAAGDGYKLTTCGGGGGTAALALVPGMLLVRRRRSAR